MEMIKKQSFLNAIISITILNVLTKTLSYLKYLLIAAYFGISVELDIYYMTFSIAMLAIFAFSFIVETNSIPHLVRALEENEESFKNLSGAIFILSILLGISLSLFFILTIPFFTSIIAVGFTPEKKIAVCKMGLYFLPWAFISFPYSALRAFYKSIRSFNIVFFAEFVCSVISVIALLLYHSDVWVLPLTFFAGYLCAFLILFIPFFKQSKIFSNPFIKEIKKWSKNFFELFVVNQLGSLSSIVDRFFQSFLLAGSISAISYVTQVFMIIGSFLSFGDIFIVPLSSTDKRKEKLERALIGLAVISIPCAIFFSYFSSEIITLLFKRGKFDESAVQLTASVFSIYGLSIISTSLGGPLLRMFQIIDKIKYIAILSVFSIIFIAIFNTIFIFHMKMEVEGIALTIVINSFLVNGISYFLIYKLGIRVNLLRVLKYAFYSFIGSIVAVSVIKFIPEFKIYIIDFISKSFIYFLIIALIYVPLRKKFYKIVYG